MKLKVCAVVLISLVLNAHLAFAQQTYTVTTIVVPSAPTGANPTALSQDGWVVGEVALCCNTYTGWMWKPAAANGTTGTVTEFGTSYWLPANQQQALRPTGVNDGYITIRGFQIGLAGSWGLVWHDGGLYSYYTCNGQPDWGPNYGVDLYAVNRLHQVAGQTCLDAGLWNDHDELPAEIVGDHPDGNGWAIALNDHGTMTGNANWFMSGLPACTATQTTHCSDAFGLAFIGGGGAPFQYLPWVPGTAGCTGSGINNADEVVGTCISHPENGGGPRAWVYREGQLIQLACSASGCNDAYARSINNQSQVVGWTGMAGIGPYLWDPVNGLRGVNSLLPTGSPVMSDAIAINDAGQILARGQDLRVYLLTPTPTTDLSLTMSAPSTVTVGDQVTYSIVVSNAGPNAATGVAVTDALPSTVSLLSTSSTAGSCSGTTTVTCAIGDLAVNATEKVTIAVSTTSTGTVSDAASVVDDQTDPSTGNNSATATTTVTKRMPVLTWTDPSSIQYGVPLGAAQLDAAADVAGTFAYSPAAGTVLHAGENQTLTVTFTPASPDDDTATASVSITVAQAPLAISADSQSKVFGAAVPPLTISYSGFVNGDGPSALSPQPAAATAATASSGVGQYPITVGGAGSSDYQIAYTPGTLTILRASTVTALAASPNPSTFGQTVTFVASVGVVAPGAGIPTGLVTFTDGGSPIGGAPVDASGVATITTASLAAGTHAIAASYAGDGSFLASASSTLTQKVNTPAAGATIADLIAKVIALTLNGGQKNSLIAKLQAAQASLDRGNTTSAANQLGAFINEVQADGQTGKVAPAAGNALIAEAQAIAASF